MMNSSAHQTCRRNPLLHTLTMLLALACVIMNSANAADERQWEFANYHIQIHIAVDTTARPQANLSEKLTNYLERRILATLFPLWSVEFSTATGPAEHLLLSQIDDLSALQKIEPGLGFDKQLLLTVTANAEGYLVACREHDLTTNNWGPVLRQQTRQSLALPEHCFYLLKKTFAPIAKIRRNLDDDTQVSLYFKGNSLPRRSDELLFAQPDTVYQPLKIRKSQRNKSRPDAISQIPWTYLTLEELQDGAGRCRVHSGIRKPFGVRRRANIENIAIALPQTLQNTRVRFHARHDKSQPLVGYEVFQRDADDQPSQLLGLTNSQGAVEVSPGVVNVRTLFLRSDGKLLAKIPVATGAISLIEVPIADDTARLKAQATITSLREQLIDLVARRNILIARVRDRAAKNQLDEARKLLSQLDALPGRAYFAQLLSTAERNERNRSTEPKVQARIEKMFADTRKLLGRFLSTRQISDLQAELNAVKQPDAS